MPPELRGVIREVLGFGEDFHLGLARVVSREGGEVAEIGVVQMASGRMPAVIERMSVKDAGQMNG